MNAMMIIAALGAFGHAAPATWPQIFDKVQRFAPFTSFDSSSYFHFETRRVNSESHLVKDELMLWAEGSESQSQLLGAMLTEAYVDISQERQDPDTFWKFELDLEGRIEYVHSADGLPVDDPRAVAKLAELRDLWDKFQSCFFVYGLSPAGRRAVALLQIEGRDRALDVETLDSVMSSNFRELLRGEDYEINRECPASGSSQ